MRKVTFTIERLKGMDRPAEYIDDLRTCALEVTEADMSFDADGACYQALLAKYRAKPAIIMPVAVQRSRGVGDTIARITTAVGIKPCGGCAKRQAALNKMFSYKQPGE